MLDIDTAVAREGHQDPKPSFSEETVISAFLGRTEGQLAQSSYSFKHHLRLLGPEKGPSKQSHLDF